MSKNKKITTASGRPYFENEDSLTAGAKGPVIFLLWPIFRIKLCIKRS